MPDTTSADRDPHDIRDVHDVRDVRDVRDAHGVDDVRDVLARYHRAMLDKSADDLADLYAADAVHEFPFLFPGMPERLRGREEIRAGYRAAWGASPARPQEIHDVVVHRSTDPEVITVEQVVSGTVTTTRQAGQVGEAGQAGQAGQAFSFPGLLVLRVRDGLIVHARDYMDGLRVAHTMGRLTAVAAALGPGPTGSPQS
ncbi:nuclear transport factor 2 family protein [Streptomyces sp. NPDC046862]|uniref:nuclear transport factor 2 family protein n=1 Tax=Streptomyces sp. NPDC046862 TaxID=3154603 RepID=UPI00345199D5